jgi:flagellar biosynthesis protein
MYTRYVRFKREQHQGDEGDEKPKRVQAVALGYDPEQDQAPRVLASGEGYVAEKILELARKNGIPIREDAILAAALANVDIDTVIPPELYAVVAEVLAYVYRMQTGYPRK